MFIHLGILGLIWAIIWFIFFRDDPKESKFVTKAELALIKNQLESVPAESHSLAEQTD